MLSAAIGFWGLAVALKRTKETGILALGARVAHRLAGRGHVSCYQCL